MGVLLSLVGRSYRMLISTMLVIVLLISLTLNVATFSVGVVASAISSAVTAVTGISTVASRYLKKDGEVVALKTELTATKAAKAGVDADLSATRKLASKWEGAALGKGLALKQETAAKAALEVEAAGLRAARHVTYDSLEMTVPEAVTRATTKIKTRTVKLAAADLSSTAAQALPWIGAAAVVAATAYDLKMSCDTMRDMRDIEVSINPNAVDDPNVEYVCGLRVPTEEEIWVAIKASPGAVWDAAKVVLDGLPSMPTMPTLGWPELPELGMPDVPDINWKFWQ